MGVLSNQEDLNGKVTAERLEENCVAVMAQSGHEGDKQSVAHQAVYRTSSFQEGAGRRVPEG